MTNILTDEECRYLARTKIKEQPSWASLTRTYNEKFDKNIDWRTLRSAIFREVPSDYWAGEINEERQLILDNFFERHGFAHLMGYMVGETIKEWKMLQDMYVRSLLEKTLTTEEREELGIEVFTMDIWSIERKDRLFDKIKDFFMTVLDKVRVLGEEGSRIIAVFEEQGLLLASGKKSLTSTETVEEQALHESQIADYLETLIERNKADIEKTFERHKAEARGIYRPIRDRPVLLDEDDEDDDDTII
jgi:hypothetical protein